MKKRAIGDIAAEIIGVSSCISMLELLIMPVDTTNNPQGTPSQDTVNNAFFGITQQLDRIADELSDIELTINP